LPKDKYQTNQVSKEFGYDESIGMQILQCAESLSSDPLYQEQLLQTCLYRRHNRLRDSALNIGDIAPNISVLDMKESCTNIFRNDDTQTNFVIIAGSIS
jgi:hypothetical protein